MKSRTVDTTMGRLRTKLEANPSEPVHLLTVFGHGYRLDVPSLEAPGLFGRVDELRAMRREIESNRVVVVLGTAGVGKTTLVRAWSEGLTTAPLWVSLTEDAGAVGLAAAVAAALGVSLAHPDPVEATARALARWDGPLIVDGLEFAVEAVAEALPSWLKQSPDLRVVATSRLSPGLPGASELRLEPLAGEAALALFEDRAGGSGADRDAVLRVVERLGGLPLAVELAASWVGVLGMEALEQRVDGFKSRDLRASIQSSWDMLDRDQQAVLVAAATFEGAFPAEAVEGVLGTLAGDALVGLHQRCLIRGEGGELRLYDAVRSFVRQLETDAEIWTRHGGWVVERSESRWLPDQVRALARLQPVEAELAAQLRIRVIDARAGVGLTREAAALGRQAVIQAEELPGAVAYDTWLAFSRALMWGADYDAAADAAQEALDRATGPRRRQWALAQLVRTRISSGEPLRALEVLDRIEVEPGEEALAGAMEHQRGNVLRMLGRTAEALAPYERAVAILSRVDTPDELSRAYLNLGSLQMDLGRPDLSFSHFSSARELARDHLPSLLGPLEGSLAETFRVMGRLQDARPAFDRATELAAGTPSVRCILLIQRSALEMEDGAIDRAAALVGRALVEAGRGQPRYRAFAILQQAGVHHVRGWTKLAAEAYEEALSLLVALGDERHQALVSGRLAALLAPTDLARAEEILRPLRAAPSGPVSIRDSVEVYCALVDLEAGVNPAGVVAKMESSDPDRPDPSRAAWNPELRFALGLLARRLEALGGVPCVGSADRKG